MTYAYFHTVRDVPHLYYTQKQEKINRKWENILRSPVSKLDTGRFLLYGCHSPAAGFFPLTIATTASTAQTKHQAAQIFRSE